MEDIDKPKEKLINKLARFCRRVAELETLETNEELLMRRNHLEELVGERTAELGALNLYLGQQITERKQVEEALRESDEFSSRLLANSPYPIVVITPDTSIRYVNSALEKLTGFSSAELIGRKPPYPYWVEETLQRTSGNFEGALANGAQRVEELFQKKNGERFWVEITSGPVIYNGEVKYYLANWVDITERKQAEEALRESEEKYKELAESITDVFFAFDKDLRYTYWNKASEKLTGVSAKDALGKQLYDVFPDEEMTRRAEKGYLKALRTQQVQSFENEYRLGGKDYFFEISAYPSKNGLSVFVKDITERKQAGEALQVEKNKLQSLIDAMEDGLSIQDRDYDIIYQNEPVKARHGDRVGEKCYRAYEGKEEVCEGCPAEKVFRDGKSHTSERRVVLPSGEVTFWEITSNPLRDAKGRVVSCLEIARNITERKRAEEAFRKLEQEKTAILDSMSEVVVSQDMEHRLVWVNKVAGESVGLATEQLVGRHCYEIWSKRDEPCVGCPVAKARETGKPQEAEMTTPDGRVWFVRGYPVRGANGDITGLVETALEITERKQTEEKRQTILKTALDGFWLVNLEGKLLEVNDSYCKMVGYRREELLEMSIPDIEAIESPEDVTQHIKKIVARGYDRFETRHKRKDGKIIDVEMSINYLDVGGGQFFVFTRDITRRKQAEKAVRDSEEKYRGLVTNVRLGVFRSTPEPGGRFLEVNPAMGEITGYSREELLEMDVADLYVNPEEREVVLEEIALGRGKPARETRLKKKDGTEIIISDTKVAVRDDSGNITYFDGIMEDITERKQAEEREKRLQQELYLSSRLASVGELAAGVAHEMNNPLTGILGFSQRLLRKSDDDNAKESLELIHNEAQRATKVVKNLLTFARRREPKKEYSDINHILQMTMDLRAYELKTGNIEVILNLADNLPQIMVDFYQIQEVFLNIILNAEQAMIEAHGGGKLTVRTEGIEDYIRISFTDDGPGIPAENLDRLFDPFFTTRGERGGTGLGLSLCHGIVAEHGGKIYARSKSGKGATILVQLPLTRQLSLATEKIDESKVAEGKLA